MRIAIISLCLFGLSAGGCASRLTSEPVGLDATPDEGVVYHMPMRLMKVTATRTAAPKQVATEMAKLKAEKAEVEKAGRELINSLVEKTRSLNTLAENEAENRTATLRAEIQVLRKKIDANVKRVEELTASIAALEAMLKAAQAGSESDDAPGYVHSIKLELEPAIPDPARRFVAKLIHSAFHDDEVTLSTTPAGLLSNGKMTSTGRQGDILIELAKTAALFVAPTPPTVSKSLRQGEDKGKADECDELTPACYPGLRNITVERRFDPSSGPAVDAVNEALKRAVFPYRIWVAGPSQNSTKRLTGSDEEWLGASNDFSPNIRKETFSPSDKLEGLFYPRPLPFQISVVEKIKNVAGDSEKTVPLQSVVTMLPNGAPLGRVPYSADAFTRSVSDVTFEDGMLTKWSADRPSVALEIARLPLRVVEAFFGAVSQLVQLKFDVSSQEKSLAEAQAAQIRAEQEILILKACLEAAGESSSAQQACFGAME